MNAKCFTHLSLATLVSAVASFAGDINSTFDADLDGWTCSAPQHISWAGGGYLQFHDQTFFDPWVDAPAKFLGTWSSLDGIGTLSYDQILIDIGGGCPCSFQSYYVRIRGPGGEATWTASPPTDGDVGVWRHIVVPIVRTNWSVASGTWAALLTNITQLSIWAELVGNVNGGHDTSGLDNVRLSAPTAPGLPRLNIQVSCVQISWASETNRFYQLQYSTDLGSTNWVESGSPILATNGVTAVEVRTLGTERRFYRVVLSP